MMHKAWILITLLLALIPEIAIGGNTRVVHADEIIFGDSTIQTTAASPGITSLTGDVTASGVGAVPATVAFVGGAAASAVATATTAANAAASVNTPSTIVRRNSSGNFAAGTITADLVGNVLGNLTGNASGSAASFTGVLAGDVSGTQSGTVVDFVGGSSAASVHTGELAANAATDADTPSTIVARDASGDFSAGQIHSTTGGFEFPDTTVQTTAATGPSIGSPVGSGTVGSVLFVGSGSVLAQDNANLFWDAAAFRLGIGTTTPATKLEVKDAGSGNLIQLDPDSSPPKIHVLYASNTAFDITTSAIPSGSQVPTITETSQVLGSIYASNGGFISYAPGSSPVDYGAGTITMWSPPGSPPFISFSERAVGFWGTLGFTSGSGDFQIHTGNQSFPSGPARLSILQSNGNVGIGTTTPGSLLDVAGSVNLSTATTPVVINDTGGHSGNVPHACVLRRSAAGTPSIACSANEIATGGEVNCGSTALFMSDSEFTGGTPGSAPPTGYQGSCTSLLNVVTNTTIVVAANCCIY